MRVGVPKERKNHEYRVGMIPDAVAKLVADGHEVVVERDAGAAVGFPDASYKEVGARIVGSAEEVYASEMVVKVKEPLPEEYVYFRPGLVLFCFLHLAAEPELTKELMDRGVTAIAFETVTDQMGRLPILIPMSEIAGRVAIQVGATALQMNNGGKGILPGGVPGTPRAAVAIIGGGVVGTEAAKMALGLGGRVTIMDCNLNRLRELDVAFNWRVTTLYASPSRVATVLASADLAVGAVLLPGKKAPKIITREMIASMEPGSVFVDVAIDQGGSAETSRPTSHKQPTYLEEGVVHYCVTNMPGSCARTATHALANALYPYLLSLANHGWERAMELDSGLGKGLNVHGGKITNKGVEEAFPELL